MRFFLLLEIQDFEQAEHNTQVCLTLSAVPRAKGEPALRQNASLTPPTAGGCLGGGTCHQQLSATSMLRQQATWFREMQFLTHLAASSPTA